MYPKFNQLLTCHLQNKIGHSQPLLDHSSISFLIAHLHKHLNKT
jgi:hypothetical protein